MRLQPESDVPFSHQAAILKMIGTVWWRFEAKSSFTPLFLALISWKIKRKLDSEEPEERGDVISPSLTALLLVPVSSLGTVRGVSYFHHSLVMIGNPSPACVSSPGRSSLGRAEQCFRLWMSSTGGRCYLVWTSSSLSQLGSG